MVENQRESNCECVETQRSSGNNNVANECCEMTNKTNSSPCCSNDPISEAKSLLERSFFTALTEVHVEKLKKQIETAFKAGEKQETAFKAVMSSLIESSPRSARIVPLGF